MSKISRLTRTCIRYFSTLALLGAAACTADTGSGQAPESDDDCLVNCGEDGTLDGGDSDPQTDDTCADVEVKFTVQTPTVVLLIDQSGSMDEDYPGGDRWSVLYDALMNPTDGVVESLQSDARLGLALYTSYDGFDGGTCPVISDVAPDLNNYQSIDDVYADAEPQEDTPTGEALTVVAGDLASLAVDGPKIIILATDGEPDTCAEPDPQNGQQVAIDAAVDAFDQGIRTFVLGVGDDVGQAHLQDMANAGAGKALDGSEQETFYQPASRAELVDNFKTIIDGQRSCVLDIDGRIDSETVAQSGTVTLDGEPLGYDDADGWRLVGDSQIELMGAACEAVKSGEHEVKGTFSCPAFVEPPR